ncbi:MAG: response regulator transcription factor [Verrucomicrobia bacterium]|nr:response regulator transcription factor [Verrucomicrobiota bacterium]
MSKRTTILLVDDHSIVRQGVRMILEKEADLEVIGEAADAVEAVAKAGESHPDVVVMDLHLSETNGIDASRRILAANPDTKIIILSAESAPEIVNRALRAGVVGYVIKEDASEELLRAIKTVIGGRFYLCPAITTALLRAQSFNSPAPIAPTLTQREREIMRFITDGMRNKEIAEKLKLSIKSVEACRSKLMAKINCNSAAELVRYAVREGIAEL